MSEPQTRRTPVMRQLILILAQQTAPSVEKLLDSLLPLFAQDDSKELLFIDDASTDDTFKIAQKYPSAHDFRNLHAIQTPRAQGYGGNQKVGFRYALEKSFDSVIVLNASKTYLPAALGTMAQMMETTQADTLLGIAEKTPRFHLLSTLQDKLAGTFLNGWHSLYKGYRTKALTRVAFELNASDPSFETELLLQLMDQKCFISPVALSLPQDTPR